MLLMELPRKVSLEYFVLCQRRRYRTQSGVECPGKPHRKGRWALHCIALDWMLESFAFCSYVHRWNVGRIPNKRGFLMGAPLTCSSTLVPSRKTWNFKTVSEIVPLKLIPPSRSLDDSIRTRCWASKLPDNCWLDSAIIELNRVTEYTVRKRQESGLQSSPGECARVCF